MNEIKHDVKTIREALKNNCLYVYIEDASGRTRIVDVRTRKGVLEVKALYSGQFRLLGSDVKLIQA